MDMFHYFSEGILKAVYTEIKKKYAKATGTMFSFKEYMSS